MTIRHLIALAIATVSTSALAGLDDLDIKTSLQGDYVLAVIAHDQRDMVTKEGSPETLVGGYIKGMFRTRAHNFTNSELSVSDSISEGLRRAFIKQKWLGVTALATTAKQSRQEVTSKIIKAGLKRTILVTVDDLWTESYRNTSVNYKFTISVLDEKANEIAKTESSGTHDTREWGDDAAGEIFSKLMTDALAKPEFIAALKL